MGVAPTRCQIGTDSPKMSGTDSPKMSRSDGASVPETSCQPALLTLRTSPRGETEKIPGHGQSQSAAAAEKHSQAMATSADDAMEGRSSSPSQQDGSLTSRPNQAPEEQTIMATYTVYDLNDLHRDPSAEPDPSNGKRGGDGNPSAVTITRLRKEAGLAI